MFLQQQTEFVVERLRRVMGSLAHHNPPVRDFESGALSGPKRDVLDRSSEPKRVFTQAGARVRDN